MQFSTYILVISLSTLSVICLAAPSGDPTAEPSVNATTVAGATTAAAATEASSAAKSSEKAAPASTAAVTSSSTTTTAKAVSASAEKSKSAEKPVASAEKPVPMIVEAAHEPLNAHQKVSQLAESKDEPSEVANSVGGKLSDAANSVKDSASDAANHVSDTASNAAKSASESVKNAVNQVQSGSAHSSSSLSILSALVFMAFAFASRV